MVSTDAISHNVINYDELLATIWEHMKEIKREEGHYKINKLPYPLPLFLYFFHIFKLRFKF